MIAWYYYPALVALALISVPWVVLVNLMYRLIQRYVPVSWVRAVSVIYLVCVLFTALTVVSTVLSYEPVLSGRYK